MKQIEQGDIIKVEHSSVMFVVVSSDFFNRSGLAVICPMVKRATEDALHVPVRTDMTDGFVLCEDLTSVSTVKRPVSVKDHIPSGLMLEIIYRIQSIFDVIQHAE